MNYCVKKISFLFFLYSLFYSSFTLGANDVGKNNDSGHFDAEKIKKENEELSLKIRNLEVQMEYQRKKLEYELYSRQIEIDKIKKDIEYYQSKTNKVIEEYKSSDDYKKKLLEYNEMVITNQMLEAKIKSLSAYRDYENAEVKSRNIIVNHKCEYLDNPLLGNGTLVLSDRTINLGFIINSFLASKVEHQIDFFNNKNPHKPIFLIIDINFGGSTLAAERIINKMKHSQSPVYVVVKELAASASAVITAAAKKSYIYQNASIVHHQPHAFVSKSLNYKEAKEITDELSQAFKRFMAPVYKKMGISWDKFIDKMYSKSVSGDWLEYGDDAVKNKFVDIVVSDIRDTSIYTKENDNNRFSLLSLLFGQKNQKSLKQMLEEDMLLNRQDFCYFYDITNNKKIINYQNKVNNIQDYNL